MDIKPLRDSAFIRSEDKLSDLQSVRQEESQTIANVHDSLESFEPASQSFENLTASAQSNFSEIRAAIQKQPAVGDNSEIQHLSQSLQELTNEKKGLTAKIVNLEQQLMAAEVAYSNSPNANNYAMMLELQKQIEQLKSQLSKVDVEIKQLMNQIEQKQAEEDATKTDIEEREQIEGTLVKDLNKAADSYNDILNNTSILD